MRDRRVVGLTSNQKDPPHGLLLRPATSIVVVKLRNRSSQVRELCDVCFGGVRVLKKAEVADLHALPWVDLEDLWNARQELWEVQRAEADALYIKNRAEWFERYDEYLASQEWKDMRAKIIQRCNGICEGCLDAPAEVVHHKTYEHVFDELAFELVGLCFACHQRIHPSAVLDAP